MIKLNDIYNYSSNLLLEMKMIPPVDISGLSSKFKEKRSGYDHQGIDIPVSSGTPIKSPLDGIIVSKDNMDTGYHDNSCGGTIRIKHSDSLTSRYCHVRKITKLKDGTPIKQGEIIGYSGGGLNDPHKGSSKGPHLHWELKENGKLVDPMKYINKNIDVADIESDTSEVKNNGESEQTDYLGDMVKQQLSNVGFSESVEIQVDKIKRLL